MEDILLPRNALQVIRGSSRALQLNVYGPDHKPFNLTGATLVMTVKDTVDDNFIIFQKSSTDSTQIQITDPFSGVAMIFLLPEDTVNRDVKEYVFDVWALIGSQKFVVIPPSIFDIQAAVTRF